MENKFSFKFYYFNYVIYELLLSLSISYSDCLEEIVWRGLVCSFDKMFGKVESIDLVVSGVGKFPRLRILDSN